MSDYDEQRIKKLELDILIRDARIRELEARLEQAQS